MDISLGKLRQLLVVAETGSFSKAAELLHISQPGLSRAIAAIEARYGFAIFNRVGRGVIPTSAGAQVIEQARPLLAAMQVFDGNLRLIGDGRTGRLSLGLAPLLASEILARFATAYFAGSVPVQLNVLVRPGNVLLEALKRDEIELFFFPDAQIGPAADVDTMPIGAIEPICVVRAGHPLTERDNLTLRDLGEFPWASSIEPPALRGLINPAQFVCDNYHILRETIVQTDLTCICSRAFVARELEAGELCEIDVPGLLPGPTTISLAQLRGRILSPLATAALDRIRQLLK